MAGFALIDATERVVIALIDGGLSMPEGTKLIGIREHENLYHAFVLTIESDTLESSPFPVRMHAEITKDEQSGKLRLVGFTKLDG